VLKRGSKRVGALLEALEPRTAKYGLHAGPAVQGVGATLANARAAVGDRSVDTGMVLRLAVLDIEHIETLLSHLSAMALARGDSKLAGFCDKWASAIRPEVEAVKKVAVNLGIDPERAAAPLDGSLLGRVAHSVGWVIGSVGETVDRVIASRRG
jgi:hypothetical protein